MEGDIDIKVRHRKCNFKYPNNCPDSWEVRRKVGKFEPDSDVDIKCKGMLKQCTRKNTF